MSNNRKDESKHGAEDDLVIGVHAEVNSAHRHEEQEGRAGGSHSHLDDVLCAEHGHSLAHDPNVVVGVQVDSHPDERVRKHVPARVAKGTRAAIRLDLIRNPEWSFLPIPALQLASCKDGKCHSRPDIERGRLGHSIEDDNGNE